MFRRKLLGSTETKELVGRQLKSKAYRQGKPIGQGKGQRVTRESPDLDPYPFPFTLVPFFG
jgi:hypothetical protein